MSDKTLDAIAKREAKMPSRVAAKKKTAKKAE
jgi:hypothetical protein